MTKYGIDCGHNAPPGDTGAVGIKREDELTIQVGKLVMDKLLELGHEIVDCTCYKARSLTSSLYSRCQKANDASVDFFVSIHFNASGKNASGSEVFFVSEAGAKKAGKVLEKICSLGFVSRGIKKKPFYVLRNTAAPAILVECCFIDSHKDMALLNVEDMAQAIVEGII